MRTRHVPALLSFALILLAGASTGATIRYSVTDLGSLGDGFTYNEPIFNENGKFVLPLSVGGSDRSFLFQSSGKTDLGTLGGSESIAFAINDAGQIVGNSKTSSGQSHAFIYANGNMTDLGTLGGTTSFAYAINGSGRAVGNSPNSSGKDRAVIYENGAVTDLGTLGSFPQSFATAINNAGIIAGQGYTSTSDDGHAFIRENSTMTDLGTLGGLSSYASAISDSGYVSGYSTIQIGSSTRHAFIYKDGVMTDIGVLPGDNDSQAKSVNETGQVIGQSGSGSSLSWAFIYKNGAISAIGTFGGFRTQANDINASGQVIGSSQNGDLENRAFIYRDGTITDLNTLSENTDVVLQEALAINDSGQIVCKGSGFRIYLLTPTEIEPSMPTPIPAPTASVSGTKRIVTTKRKLIIKGIASGNVTSVNYRVGSHGGYKTAAGTNFWKFTAVLNRGKNAISIFATGLGGDSAPLKLVVTLK